MVASAAPLVLTAELVAPQAKVSLELLTPPTLVHTTPTLPTRWIHVSIATEMEVRTSVLQAMVLTLALAQLMVPLVPTAPILLTSSILGSIVTWIGQEQLAGMPHTKIAGSISSESNTSIEMGVNTNYDL